MTKYYWWSYFRKTWEMEACSGALSAVSHQLYQTKSHKWSSSLHFKVFCSLHGFMIGVMIHDMKLTVQRINGSTRFQFKINCNGISSEIFYIHNELGPNMWIWIWGPCRAFWSLPLSEYLMLYSPASSRGKKFPQIEFGIQWLLPAFRINVTISLNLAANYNLGGEAQSFPSESLSQSFYFVSTNVFKGRSGFMENKQCKRHILLLHIRFFQACRLQHEIIYFGNGKKFADEHIFSFWINGPETQHS